MKSFDSTKEIRQWFLSNVRKLWPAAIGSLSFRKGPCIRKNCSACAAGVGHSSYALYGRSGNRRFSVYIPEELAPQVQQALKNGRKLQELMAEAARSYALALKSEHSPARKKRRTR